MIIKQSSRSLQKEANKNLAKHQLVFVLFISIFTMASLLPLLVIIFFTFHAESKDPRRVYLVYMNGGSGGNYATRTAHFGVLDQILEDRTPSESHIYSYKESFTGFAARLTDAEQQKLASMEGVVAVLPSRKFQLQTTRSWDFLGFPSTVKRQAHLESNLIVGVIDSGIWPELESFRDEGLSPPPSKWKGICQNITCNNKIVGARSYYTGNAPLVEGKSVLDISGHGTHTASIVAGMEVRNASFFGLAEGTARGGVPSARIAAYKVCWNSTTGETCEEQDLLAAFEDAISDGVDMISISIASSVTTDYITGGIGIGSFRAMKRGILTSAAGGNYGPEPSTVSNVAPWILTVASSSIDRKIVGEVELGNGERLIGNTINGFPTQESFYPLVYGVNGELRSIGKSARKGDPKLVSNTTKEKNVICLTQQTVVLASETGAQGVIWSTDTFKDQSCPILLPGTCVASIDGEKVKNYVNKTRNPVGKIHKSRGIHDPEAPIVAFTSARGPTELTPNILKPDITAPGINILAAWSTIASPSLFYFPTDKRSSAFNIISGTSMACPHATGAALYVKAFHPSWSPSAIKSALMTTAFPMSAEKNPDAEFSYGAGQLNPVQAINPGLVYDATEIDYIKFLCSEGYPILLIKLISGDDFVNCSNNNSSAKDLNYPTMSFKVETKKNFSVVFPRTVTNVGKPNSIYKAKTNSPSHLSISVTPKILSFKSLNEKLQFRVRVSGRPLAVNHTISASLIWSDGKHNVRSPIVIFA